MEMGREESEMGGREDIMGRRGGEQLDVEQGSGIEGERERITNDGGTVSGGNGGYGSYGGRAGGREALTSPHAPTLSR